MDLAIKKNQSFRLPVELLKSLKRIAKVQNRSLNNYVETELLEAAAHEPNKIILSAMKEVENGSLRNKPALDLTSIETMGKTL